MRRRPMAVPVVSFAAVEHQPIAHRGKRLRPQGKAVREDLRANVPLFSIGALAPLDSPRPGRTRSRGKLARCRKRGPRLATSTKSFTLGRIAGNSGALLRSAGRIRWILMAEGSIGPSGLTLELHVSPLRQPSPLRSISTKPTSMMMPGALQAKGCLRMNSASGVRLPVVSASKATSRSNRRGNSASTSRSQAAPIRTRFANRRHGVRPNDSPV